MAYYTRRPRSYAASMAATGMVSRQNAASLAAAGRGIGSPAYGQSLLARTPYGYAQADRTMAAGSLAQQNRARQMQLVNQRLAASAQPTQVAGGRYIQGYGQTPLRAAAPVEGIMPHGQQSSEWANRMREIAIQRRRGELVRLENNPAARVKKPWDDPMDRFILGPIAAGNVVGAVRGGYRAAQDIFNGSPVRPAPSKPVRPRSYGNTGMAPSMGYYPPSG